MALFIYSYLIDDEGDFVTDENGDKIIIDVDQADAVTEPVRRVARKPKCGYVKSFDIRYKASDGAVSAPSWHLTVNKTEYVGRYTSRDAAVSVLWGMATACNGRDDAISQAFDAQLTRGVSSIDTEPGE